MNPDKNTKLHIALDILNSEVSEIARLTGIVIDQEFEKSADSFELLGRLELLSSYVIDARIQLKNTLETK